MTKRNSKFRLILFLTVLTFSVPISMGCFESTVDSVLGNDPLDGGDTITQTDSGHVIDTVIEIDTTEPNTSSALRRNSDESGSNILLDLLNTVSRTVSSLLGGIVSTVDMTLEIPAQALNKTTTITVDIPDPDFYIYEFGPEGLQFNTPATITISYEDADLSGIDESRIKLAWWDDSAQAWVDMPCTVDFVNNSVSGPIEHFSAYGLVSD